MAGLIPCDRARGRKDWIQFCKPASDAGEAAGLAWEGFEIRAQAQYAGGTPERWRGHADKWRELGATHLAIATHNAGPTDVDGHLARVAEYRDALAD